MLTFDALVDEVDVDKQNNDSPDLNNFSVFVVSFFLFVVVVVGSIILPLQCGSCWAFSVVGAMQSVHAIGGSRLEQLSVQQILDCSFENQGCNGGSPFRALNWLKQVW